MNLQPIMALTEGTLFRDLQDFVRDGIVARIDEIVYRSTSRYHTHLRFARTHRGTHQSGPCSRGTRRASSNALPRASRRDSTQVASTTSVGPSPRLRSFCYLARYCPLTRSVPTESLIQELLRQDYVTHRNLEVVEEVSNGMAELTGQYQNFSLIGKYIPMLWIVYTW